MMEVPTLFCRDRRWKREGLCRFPVEVEALLKAYLAGQSVLHLFGGKAAFGVRLDIDPLVRPHVVGDAWLPPFAAGSFDVVVLDPPYRGLNSQQRAALFYTAAFLARAQVVWFHTAWVVPSCRLRLIRAWSVICGRSCAMRCLQVSERLPGEVAPVRKFSRGPAIRYNRWLAGAMPLPFGPGTAAGVVV